MLLTQGIPTDRNVDKKFMTWLRHCNLQLDKTTMFSDLLPDQASLRKRFGENATYFRAMSDGSRTIKVCRCASSLYS
jgi:hypothetical protein